MLVEIINVNVGSEKIVLEANAIEEIIMAEDLFEDVEVPVVRYSFDRKARNYAEMKYLRKIVNSQKKCQSEKSMGAKLVGVIIQIFESFRTTEYFFCGFLTAEPHRCTPAHPAPRPVPQAPPLYEKR